MNQTCLTHTAALCPRTELAGFPFANGVFGTNLEITRRCYYGGLSAEMLNNRKLNIGAECPDGWTCERFRRVLDRPEESLCESSFVILQNGSMTQTTPVIATKKGEQYEARVWVKAVSDTAVVTFGLAGREQRFEIAADGAAYQALSFVFEGDDLDNGTFAVKVTGEAAVFEASLMPTDHFYGMRRDVIEQLKVIAPTSIRFPGGCAADHVDWKESLKSPEFRKPADDRGKEWFLFRDSCHQDPLDIGVNEFMMLCKELNAEPEYTVSLLLSDGEDARHLVEYCNGGPETEYGAKRQALGFDPFQIKLWYIGNEAYFFGEEYKASAAAAAKRTDELTLAMKQADPTISTVIGVTWGNGFQEWSKEFMANLTSPFEYVSFHDYIGILPDDTQGQNGMATCEILETIFADGASFGLDFYKDQLYRDNFDHIRICVDEWNYSWGYDSSNALFFSNGLQFHFLAKSREKYHIERAQFFLPVNEGMITVRGNLCRLESTGEMFRLLAPHKDGRVIPCDCDRPELDILCTDHGDWLYLSVVNRSPEPCPLEVKGYRAESCTEIEVQDYSFASNEFAVCGRETPMVSGHSMAFVRLARA